MKWRFAGLMLLVVVIGGCIKEPNSDVDPSQYYTSYFLFYDAGLELSQPIVIFTGNDADGFRQELKGTGSVTFRNQNLTFDRSLLVYRTTINEYVSSGEFKYTDIFGVEYIIQIKHNIVDFPVELDTVDILDELQFFWEGDPLEEGEFITLEIFEPELQFGETFTADELGATSIVVPSIGLTKFGVGTVKFNLTRERVTDADPNPGVGGVIRSVYTLSKDVEFVDESIL